MGTVKEVDSIREDWCGIPDHAGSGGEDVVEDFVVEGVETVCHGEKVFEIGWEANIEAGLHFGELGGGEGLK